MARIYVAGSINLDITLQVERRPKLGETIVGNDVIFGLGGKGSNHAVAAARLEAPVEIVGCVGEDHFGEVLLEYLSAENLSLEHVRRVEGCPSGMALITVDANSENAIVIIPGANASVTPTDAKAVSLDAGDIAVSQLEIPQPTIQAFFEHARDAGATTILNPAPAEEFHEPILPLVEYLIVNETEALFYSDEDEQLPLSEERLVKICSDMRVHEEQTIVVTLGDEGVFASTPAETVILDPHTVDPVDTTGAGDAFVGAFATSLAEEMSLQDALAFANAAGAVATTSVGASPSLPSREEIQALLSAQ